MRIDRRQQGGRGVSLCLLLLLLLAAAGGSGDFSMAQAADEAGGDAISIQLIDNGDFEETAYGAIGAYWLATAGRGRVSLATDLVTTESARSGVHSLRVPSPSVTAYQYVAAPEDSIDQLVVRASLRLACARGSCPNAELTLRDGDERTLTYVIGESPRLPSGRGQAAYLGRPIAADGWTDFEFAVGQDFLAQFGQSLQPRVTVELGMQEGTEGRVFWDDIEVEAAFPSMSEAGLLERILDEAEWVIGNLSALARDDIGASSPYFVKVLDAITGEVLSVNPVGGGGPVYNQMLAVLSVRDVPAYKEALVEMADAILAHRNPETGLQRRFDPETEAPLDATAIPAPTIDFLLRVYELTGDARYLQGATEFGEAILAFAPLLWENRRAIGLLPQGFLANKFDSGTGEPFPPESTYEIHIRWLASAGALIHLYTATGREDFRDAALESALGYVDHKTTLEYWNEEYSLDPFSFEPAWYDWDLIDPAFDDYFGYGIGGRKGPYGILDIYERTDDERLRPFLDESLAFMLGVWEEGILRGGYTFADDARSWQAYADRYEADPITYAAHRDLLIRNARNVFRASQTSSGDWIDARFRQWSASFPNDQASCPRNLLGALTYAYLVDERDPIWLAMIDAVFEQTVETYKRPYGYLRHPDGEQEGANPGGIELRFLGELLTHLIPALAESAGL